MAGREAMMTNGRWWKIGLVGLVFAGGLASGLAVRQGNSAADAGPRIVSEVAYEYPTEHVACEHGGAPAHRTVDLHPPELGAVCSTDSLAAESPPSFDDPATILHAPPRGLAVDLHPPTEALPHCSDHLGNLFAGGPPGEGPQLHPPDEPSVGGPALPDPHRTAEARGDAPPGRLPPPVGAVRVPQGAHGKYDELLKSLIAKELPEATAEERDVWFEQIRGMDPAAARYLLELRRRLGSAGEDAFRLKPGATADIVDAPADDEPAPLPAREREDVAHGPSPLPPPAWPKPIDDSDGRELLPPEPEVMDSLADESVIVRPLEAAMSAVRQARGVVVNNIANAHTFGFKKSRVEFVETPYELHVRADRLPYFAAIGEGVNLRTRFDFSQGPVRKTGRPLDIAIDGAGWLQVQLGDRIGYTRGGRLFVNGDGEVVVRLSGRSLPIEPTVVIPEGATKVVISETGRVEVEEAGKTERTAWGQFQLVKFVSDDLLLPRGAGLFISEGKPQVGSPGDEGFGKLRQGCLEGSNVEVECELAELRSLRRHARTLIEAVWLMQDDEDLPEDEEDDDARHVRASDDNSCCGKSAACGREACRRSSCERGLCGHAAACQGDAGGCSAACPKKCAECPAEGCARAACGAAGKSPCALGAACDGCPAGAKPCAGCGKRACEASGDDEEECCPAECRTKKCSGKCTSKCSGSGCPEGQTGKSARTITESPGRSGDDGVR